MITVWGWDERRAEEAAGLQQASGFYPAAEPARVVAVERSGARIVTDSGEGRLTGSQPVTGDWLLVSGAGTGADGLPLFRMEAMLARRSLLSRKAPGLDYSDQRAAQALAANIDTIFAVTACGSDFSPGRIERFVTLAYDSGAAPVILLTKIDLDPSWRDRADELESGSPAVPVLPVSARMGEGMDALAPWLVPGRTIVTLGSSGVGKSTLLNAIAGRTLAATSAVRDADGKGRHTTTRRELFLLDSGVMVIDSPGIREVQLWADAADVDAAFPEIEAAAAECRFRDCAHGEEPGCAVRAAVESGAIAGERFERWARMRREVAALDRRTDPEAAAAERSKWRMINKSMRAHVKFAERRGMR